METCSCYRYWIFWLWHQVITFNFLRHFFIKLKDFSPFLKFSYLIMFKMQRLFHENQLDRLYIYLSNGFLFLIDLGFLFKIKTTRILFFIFNHPFTNKIIKIRFIFTFANFLSISFIYCLLSFLFSIRLFIYLGCNCLFDESKGDFFSYSLP